MQRKTAGFRIESAVIKKVLATFPENKSRPDTQEIFIWKAKGLPILQQPRLQRKNRDL